MADIFISYAREDEKHAVRLAAAFTGHGWTVFWDRSIPAGKTWRQVIGNALADARCVIVLWSQHSVKSNWVLEEADRALERDVLVPVLIDRVASPLGYGAIQAADLIAWKEGDDERGLDDFIAVVVGRIGTADNPPATAGDKDAAQPRELSAATAERPPADGQQRIQAEATLAKPALWTKYALTFALLVIAGWIIRGPAIHHDMPGINMFVITIATLGLFIALPIRPSGALVASFGLQSLNLFAMWTTMTPTTNLIDPAGVFVLIGAALVNGLLVGIVCRWRLARRGGTTSRARGGPRSARASLHVAGVTQLVLLWSAYSATALTAKYVWVLRERQQGLESTSEMMLVVGALWVAVCVVGIAVGLRARKVNLPEGVVFAWCLAPLTAVIYFYNWIALADQLSGANGYYSALINATNLGAFTVALASAFGLWLFASTLSGPDERQVIPG